MYIKNIFNVINYKGLPDGYKADFDNITYIVGDNAKIKLHCFLCPYGYLQNITCMVVIKNQFQMILIKIWIQLQV